MASNEITQGRRTVSPLSCTDSELRFIVAQLASAIETLGNPAKPSKSSAPISAKAYPETIVTDFELLGPFDGSGEAMGRVIDMDGNPVEESTETDTFPTGSPIPPAVIDVCTWPGQFASADEGDRGIATYRQKDDGTWCWWVTVLWEGDPQGGPENGWDFEDDITDTYDGDDATDGDGTYTAHSPPSSGKAICFTAATIDHWVIWPAGTCALTAGGWTYSCWVKVPYASGTCVVINKQKNGGTGSYADAEWFIETDSPGTNQNFIFSCQFLDSGGSAIAATTTESDQGTWLDDEWHLVTVKIVDLGSSQFKAGISIDGGAFSYSPTTTLTGTPAEQTTGVLLANTTDSSPSAGVTTGDETYCLDHIRFWSDREVTDAEAEMMYNGGTIT